MKLEELFERSQAERKQEAGVEADQFFTQPRVAARFAQWVKQLPFFTDVSRIIEPAAGAKDVAQHFPGIEMYDLFPQSDDITQQDFLQSSFEPSPGTLVVMNPPYGKSSDLAIQFFNKAASFADYIAMIVPRTFRRSSIQNRLAQTHHLVDEYVLPRNSFYLPAEGGDMKPYDVPAVAQAWERREGKREIEQPRRTSQHFAFVRPEQADFAFRRKGRRAGQVTEVEGTNPNSFFYIQGGPDVRQAFQNVDWSQMGHDVMGARSISQPEIITAVEQAL